MNAYTRTDQQLHYLCQVITKANRTFVPTKDDDSHTNLYFDNLENRITGRWINSGDKKILFALNLDKVSFQFLDTSLNVMAEVAPISKTIDVIEKEVESLLPQFGLNPEGFSADLHYEIPKYSFTGEPIQPFDVEGLKAWKEYRSMANAACFSLLGLAQVWEEVRIWPHHFDTGIYFKCKEKLGVGFGLAMEDDMAGSPYFYMSAYPEGGEINYSDLPQGHWKWKISDQWKGAILTLDELEKASPSERKGIVLDYVKTVYKWIINQ